MSNFTRSITKSYEFDKDLITVKMNRLSRINAQLIMPHVEKMSGDKNKFSLDEAMSFMNDASKVIQDSVKEINGLFVEGEEVKVGTELFDEVVGSTYFMNLLMEISNDLISESFLSKDDEKKSEGQPGGI